MRRYVIGADIGGTTVKLGVFTREGELLDKWEIPTNTDNQGSHILEDVAEACLAYMADHNLSKEDFDGIGVGIPGTVNEDGSVNTCVNLGWGYRNVREEMEQALGLPAFTENDANAAALGEMWKGGAVGVRNLVMVTLGTGVGGGIIVNGKALHGARGYAGEIGHITIRPEEEIACNCGRKGCLEQYCSANGIARVAKADLEGYKGESCLRDLSDITAKDVFDAAREGDSFALSQLERFGRDLGMALSNLATVLDPEVFIIGGGVSRAGTMLTDLVKKYYNRYALEGQKDVDFRLALLENDAGIIGCASLAIRQD